MASFGNFKAQAKTAAPDKARKPSRYAGIALSKPRTPLLRPGHYVLGLTDLADGISKKTKDKLDTFTFVVVHVFDDAPAGHKVDDEVVYLRKFGGKSNEYAIEDVSRICAALAGYGGDDIEEWSAFNPDGYFVDACEGESNEYSKDGNPVVGRMVEVYGERGAEILKDGKPTGEYYTNCTWTPIINEDQARLVAPSAE